MAEISRWAHDFFESTILYNCWRFIPLQDILFCFAHPFAQLRATICLNSWFLCQCRRQKCRSFFCKFGQRGAYGATTDFSFKVFYILIMIFHFHLAFQFDHPPRFWIIQSTRADHRQKSCLSSSVTADLFLGISCAVLYQLTGEGSIPLQTWQIKMIKDVE